MGSPYLSSNESIILSTNNVVINSVQAEAILTNERLMLIDARHAELRPQDIPFHAIETVIIGEDSNADPLLSLSLVTGPGVTLSMSIVFPQPPKMRRIAERDEWANRLKELSIVTVREGGSKSVELVPPWVPGPLPEPDGTPAAPAPGAEAESKFRNPPLMPRKPQPAAQKNTTLIAAVVVVILLIALAVGGYFFAPSLFGKSAPAPEITPPPTTVQTTVPTAAPVTSAVPAATVATPEAIIPETGVYIRVQYEGSYSGSAGAPERITNVSSTGNTIRQLSVKDEVVSATVQKLDNTGRKLSVDIYNKGKLIASGSSTAPKGTVVVSADLRTS